MDRAFGAVHSILHTRGGITMAEAAKLLKQAIDHKDASKAQRNKARFYRAAALSNCGEHAEALKEALQ